MIDDEARAINDRLDTMSKGMGDMAQAQAAQTAVCEIRCRLVDQHDTILHGPATNGNSPGVLTRMANQEVRLEAHEKAQAKTSRIVWASYGAVGTATLGFGFILFKAVLGF